MVSSNTMVYPAQIKTYGLPLPLTIAFGLLSASLAGLGIHYLTQGLNTGWYTLGVGTLPIVLLLFAYRVEIGPEKIAYRLPTSWGTFAFADIERVEFAMEQRDRKWQKAAPLLTLRDGRQRKFPLYGFAFDALLDFYTALESHGIRIQFSPDDQMQQLQQTIRLRQESQGLGQLSPEAE